MKHIVISDTHSPFFILKIYHHLRSNLLYKNVDAIVINGDLLGTFSISKSSKYKKSTLDNEEYLKHLQEGAPAFFSKIKGSFEITQELVEDYVKERYNWCLSILIKFSKLRKTIFNCGNHESEHQMLVLNEISSLIGDFHVDIPKLKKYAREFDRNLLELEKKADFHYLRHEPLVLNNTLILGIPGESHDPFSKVQEKKTIELLKKAKEKLINVNFLIIYNHTHGNYDRETGAFWCSSPSLDEFMNNLPSNIVRKIFVQSHNHWSYSKFINYKNFSILMNNAGLHNGLYNLIDFTALRVECKDLDSSRNTTLDLKQNNDFSPIKDELDLIKRFYNDPEYILRRKQGY